MAIVSLTYDTIAAFDNVIYIHVYEIKYICPMYITEREINSDRDRGAKESICSVIPFAQCNLCDDIARSKIWNSTVSIQTKIWSCILHISFSSYSSTDGAIILNTVPVDLATQEAIRSQVIRIEHSGFNIRRVKRLTTSASDNCVKCLDKWSTNHEVSYVVSVYFCNSHPGSSLVCTAMFRDRLNPVGSTSLNCYATHIFNILFTFPGPRLTITNIS